MFKSIIQFGYLVSFLVLGGAFALSINQPAPNSRSTVSRSVLADVSCSTTGSTIFANQIGPSRMELMFDAQGLTSISRVDFILIEDGSTSEKVLGRGVKDNANPQLWRMIWDTRYYKTITTAFPGRFRTTVHFTNNTNCFTPSSPIFNIQPNNTPSIPNIEAVINPPQWSSLVNTSTNVFVDFINLPPELHPYVIVTWQPQIGFINSPFTRSAVYSTGPSAGSGKLRVSAIYANKYFQKDADIAVYSSTSSSGSGGSTEPTGGTSSSGSNTTTTTTSNTGSSSDDEEELPEIRDDASVEDIIRVLTPTTTEPSALSAPSRAIALVLQSNDEVKACIESRVGSETLANILRENRRPRGSEFKTFIRCFESQRNIVPSILAPVAPEEVKTATKTNLVAIKGLTNSTRKNTDDSEKTTLLISGTATANSDVLLYVFSEPLVLATTADSEGNWSYTLEDPLEPGEHEVYAVVDRGDGVYERSDLSTFIIGTATASEDNPNGLSLELVSEPTISASNRSTNLYIAATIGIVTLCAAFISGYFLFSFAGRRSRKQQMLSGLPNQPGDQIQPETTFKNFTDQQ